MTIVTWTAIVLLAWVAFGCYVVRYECREWFK